jgi:hypothetical protein
MVSGFPKRSFFSKYLDHEPIQFDWIMVW